MYPHMQWIVVLFGLVVFTDAQDRYHYPADDTTPSADYLMLDASADDFPAYAYYTSASLSAPPRAYLTKPVGGAFGSCTYTRTGGGVTTSDTCLSYLRSNTASGCTYQGNPCQVSWNCQSAVRSGAVTFYMCGCNQNDPLSCPNGGTCKSLVIDFPAEITANNDDDQPLYDSGTPLHTLHRKLSYCECLVDFQHWRMSGYVPYGSTDPRLAFGPISLQTFTGYFDPLVSGDEMIIAPCTRKADSVCPNGIPSYLFVSAAIYTFDLNKFIPCLSAVRGTPGCSYDVIPCICDPGYFGDFCGGQSFASNRCGYSDLTTPPPVGTFSTGNLCYGRGTCAGGSGYDFDLQNPKDPSYNPSLVYCTSCVGAFWGAQCRVTCGYTNANATTTPNCPDHAQCINTGTHLSPVAKCDCDSGYVDPYNDGQPGSPTDDSTNCVTCTNELAVDVPNCNSMGTCPTGTYTCALLGCPVLTHLPSVPLKCVCPSYYVDEECAVPNNITYTCGSQTIAVSCTYKRTVADTEFRYDCSISTTLHTGTTPDEEYPFSIVCHDVTLTDTDVLSASSLLRLLQGDDGCAAVRSQCSTEYSVVDICPVPFRDFDVVTSRPSNAFCDAPASRQYVKAVYGPTGNTVTVFCWMTSESPDKFLCQTAPLSTGALVISNCLLAVNWDSVRTRPDAMFAIIQQYCNPR
jgi:hypothetical protein